MVVVVVVVNAATRASALRSELGVQQQGCNTTEQLQRCKVIAACAMHSYELIPIEDSYEAKDGEDILTRIVWMRRRRRKEEKRERGEVWKT